MADRERKTPVGSTAAERRDHYKDNYYTCHLNVNLETPGNLSGVCSRYPIQISKAKAPFVSQPGHLQQQCENYSAIKVHLYPNFHIVLSQTVKNIRTRSTFSEMCLPLLLAKRSQKSLSRIGQLLSVPLSETVTYSACTCQH